VNFEDAVHIVQAEEEEWMRIRRVCLSLQIRNNFLANKIDILSEDLQEARDQLEHTRNIARNCASTIVEFVEKLGATNQEIQDILDSSRLTSEDLLKMVRKYIRSR